MDPGLMKKLFYIAAALPITLLPTLAYANYAGITSMGAFISGSVATYVVATIGLLKWDKFVVKKLTQRDERKRLEKEQFALSKEQDDSSRGMEKGRGRVPEKKEGLKEKLSLESARIKGKIEKFKNKGCGEKIQKIISNEGRAH